MENCSIQQFLDSDRVNPLSLGSPRATCAYTPLLPVLIAVMHREMRGEGGSEGGSGDGCNGGPYLGRAGAVAPQEVIGLCVRNGAMAVSPPAYRHRAQWR